MLSEQIVRRNENSGESIQELVSGYNERLEKMKQKLSQSKLEKENFELIQVRLQNENRMLQQKLKNLEALFLAGSTQGPGSNFSVKKA